MFVSHTPTSELPVLRKVIRSSTIDLIAEEIRNAIYSGSLPPGQSINEVRTADVLGVSRPSLREALQRLVSEGVMSHAPGRGVWVRAMTSADIDDVYAMREAIESQAAKMVIRSGRAGVGITRALGELERAIEAQEARAIGDADLEFHHEIVAASRSMRLQSAMKVSMVHTRLLSLSDEQGYEVRCDLIESHRELAQAIETGEESRALDVLARIMAEAVARLHHSSPAPEAVMVAETAADSHVEDQWSQLLN